MHLDFDELPWLTRDDKIAQNQDQLVVPMPEVASGGRSVLQFRFPISREGFLEVSNLI